jgi:hypothetical protein
MEKLTSLLRIVSLGIRAVYKKIPKKDTQPHGKYDTIPLTTSFA